jgi:hypothetical protein
MPLQFAAFSKLRNLRYLRIRDPPRSFEMSESYKNGTAPLAGSEVDPRVDCVALTQLQKLQVSEHKWSSLFHLASSGLGMDLTTPGSLQNLVSLRFDMSGPTQQEGDSALVLAASVARTCPHLRRFELPSALDLTTGPFDFSVFAPLSKLEVLKVPPATLRDDWMVLKGTCKRLRELHLGGKDSASVSLLDGRLFVEIFLLLHNNRPLVASLPWEKQIRVLDEYHALGTTISRTSAFQILCSLPETNFMEHYRTLISHPAIAEAMRRADFKRQSGYIKWFFANFRGVELPNFFDLFFAPLGDPTATFRFKQLPRSVQSHVRAAFTSAYYSLNPDAVALLMGRIPDIVVHLESGFADLIKNQQYFALQQTLDYLALHDYEFDNSINFPVHTSALEVLWERVQKSEEALVRVPISSHPNSLLNFFALELYEKESYVHFAPFSSASPCKRGVATLLAVASYSHGSHCISSTLSSWSEVFRR